MCTIAIMVIRRETSFVRFWVGLLIVGIAAADNAEEKPCNKLNCPGPLMYYESLGCQPIYQNPGDCCAIRYDCSHMFNRSTDKCYANGHEYNIGENLRDVDAEPCDTGCFCSEGYNKIARFTCAVVDCFQTPRPGCYLKNSPQKCCSGPEVCPESPDDIPKCEVDGKVYLDGEYFKPKSDPQKSCYCMEDYKGENIEPFCRTTKNYCNPEKRHMTAVHGRCAPTYYYSQSPKTSCSFSFRCQNERDEVIHRERENTSEQPSGSEDMKCKFGNLMMNIGDELNQATHYDSVCIKCICEVPPIPTCQRLSDDECDITVHPPFDKFS